MTINRSNNEELSQNTIETQANQTIISTTQENASEIKRRGLMLVISAPSGVGKTTIAKMLLESDSHIKLSVSCTTRNIRPGEIDGIDYFFKTVDDFKEIIKNDGFLEYAEVFNNLYGTPRNEVERNIINGEDVLFEIDWQGHRQLISRARQDVVSIFILPPCKEELLRRIKDRGQDTHEVILSRIEKTNWEMCHWHEYDYIVINRCLQETLEKIHSILRAERLKKERRTGLPEFVDTLIKQDISHLLLESN